MYFCRRCRKTLRKLGIKQDLRESSKNNDTVMEMLLVELEDGRAAPTLYLEDLYKGVSGGRHYLMNHQGLWRCLLKVFC